MFALPDGSTFAVAGPRELGQTSRTFGFLVADLDEAVLYELVERVGGDGIEPPTSWV